MVAALPIGGKEALTDVLEDRQVLREAKALDYAWGQSQSFGLLLDPQLRVLQQNFILKVSMPFQALMAEYEQRGRKRKAEEVEDAAWAEAAEAAEAAVQEVFEAAEADERSSPSKKSSSSREKRKKSSSSRTLKKKRKKRKKRRLWGRG
jgi:hypothetical protein